jgi:hypothetical protein
VSNAAGSDPTDLLAPFHLDVDELATPLVVEMFDNCPGCGQLTNMRGVAWMSLYPEWNPHLSPVYLSKPKSFWLCRSSMTRWLSSP